MVVSFSASTADLDTKHTRRTSNDDYPSISPTTSGNIRPIAAVLSMPVSPPQSFSVISSSSSTSSSPRSHTHILAHSHSRPQAPSSRSSASTTPSQSPSSIISLQRTARQTKRHLHHPSTQQRTQEQRTQVHFVPGQNRSALLYTSAQLEEQQRQHKLQQKELERQRRQQQQQQNNEKMELDPPKGHHSSKSSGPRSRLSSWAASIRHTFSPKSKSGNNRSATSTPVTTTLCSGGPIVPASSPLSSDIPTVATATTATSTTTTTTTVEASKAEPDSFSQPLHDLDHDSVPSPSSAAYTLQATSPQSQQQNSQQQQTAHNIPQVDQRKAAPVAQEKSSKPKKKSSFPRWSSSSFSTPKNTAAAGTATGFDPSTAPFPFHPASSKETTSSPISPSPYCPADQPRIRLRNQKRRRRVGAGLITIFCIAAIVILVLC